MARPLRLWLVRHARPMCAEGLCYGASDIEADGAATQEAAAVLAGVLPQNLRVRHSPLRRCVQLGAALLALRPDVRLQADPGLAEMDFGAWEGRSWASIGQAEVERWTRDFATHRCGGGESVHEFLARVAAALGHWEGEEEAWITHAGVASAVRWLAGGQGVPPDAAAWPPPGLAFGAWDRLDLPRTVRAALRENVQRARVARA